MTKQALKVQIRELMKDLTRNGFDLRVEKRVVRQLELHLARVEIYKSIAHRQGLIIEIQDNELRFEKLEVAA
jgi:hypothetical protein